MEQQELTQKFSPLQIGVFNSALDAAIKKAKLFIGDLVPDEKQLVIDELEKLKLHAPHKEMCEWCKKKLNPDETYIDPFLTGLYGYAYCSQECVDAHIEGK